MVDLSSMEASLNELGDLKATGENTAELLRRAVEATRKMPTVSGAGLMLVDGEQALRSVAASDEAGHLLEAAQEDATEGPCVDSFVRNEVVTTSDVTADTRWPRLAPLLDSEQVRAVLGMPVHIGGGAVGTLNVYVDQPHEWTGTEIAALGAFAGVVDILLTSSVAHQRSDRLAQQLQYALDYRVVIERAVGYLMHRDRVDSVAAFRVLRSTARNNRRKVVDVARDLLDGPPSEVQGGQAGRSATSLAGSVRRVNPARGRPHRDVE